MLADRVHLMDEVLNADDSVLAQRLLNDGVVRDGNSLLVHFGIAPLVNQLAHALQIRVSEKQMFKSLMRIHQNMNTSH